MVDVESVLFKLRGWNERYVRPNSPAGFINVPQLDQDMTIIEPKEIRPPFFMNQVRFFWGDVYLAFTIQETKKLDIFQRSILSVYPKLIVEDIGDTNPQYSVPYIQIYSRIAGTSIPGPVNVMLNGLIPIIIGAYMPRPMQLFTDTTSVIARLYSLDPITTGAASTQTNAWGSVLAGLRFIDDVDEFIASVEEIEKNTGEEVTAMHAGVRSPLIPLVK